MGEKFPIEYLINLLTLKIKSLEIRYWLARSFLVAAIYSCVHISLSSKSNQFLNSNNFFEYNCKFFYSKIENTSFIYSFIRL